MAEKNYIAVDLGAESGRVILGRVTKDTISLEEIHRFSNGSIEQNGSLRWDFERLMVEIKKGITKAINREKQIASIGVDTWGVDFGLLDKHGKLLENPYHYRDCRTDGMLEEAFHVLPSKKIYANTGIQFMQINSLYQLLSYRKHNSEMFKKSSKLLFMSDLIVYYLTGEIANEYTIASTSQLMDMRTRQWSQEVLDAFGLPANLLSYIIQPGTVAGNLKKEIATEAGCDTIPVVAVGSHDTASAVAGVPARQDKNWAYLSSGTWSLIGIETKQVIINGKSFKYQFTNEGGVAGTIRLLKNVSGLWLVQQCRSYWAEHGTELSYSELTRMASDAEPFRVMLDTNYKPFLSVGEMPDKINEYLESTGQNKIQDKGQMARVIMESLAAKYAEVIGILEELSGDDIEVLHIVGGGTKNSLLNQFAADATGKQVTAGPVEATATGNIMIQSMASGQVSSLGQARQIVANSFKITEYQPQNQQQWQQYFQQGKKLGCLSHAPERR